MGAGCHLGPPVHGAADPAHRGSAGAAGRLSGHGPRHRRFRGVRAVQPLERHPPRHRERRHGLPHQAHLEQARPAPCPRGRQPHGLQGRGLPPRIPLRTRRLRFRGVQVRRCRGRLGGRQDPAHRRRAFRLLSGALGLVHAGPAGQGPAPPAVPAEGYPYFTYLDFFDILEAFGAPLPKPIAAPAAAPLPRAESFAFGTNPISKGIV